MARGRKRIDPPEQDTDPLMDYVPQKPLEIVGITSDPKGNIIGLGNNGLLYKYHTETRGWVLI